jgi:hypothetical protein
VHYAGSGRLVCIIQHTQLVVQNMGTPVLLNTDITRFLLGPVYLVNKTEINPQLCIMDVQ